MASVLLTKSKIFVFFFSQAILKHLRNKENFAKLGPYLPNLGCAGFEPATLCL